MSFMVPERPQRGAPAVLFRRQDVLLPKKCSHDYLLIVKGKRKKNRVSWKGIKVQYDKLPKSNQRPKRAEK